MRVLLASLWLVAALPAAAQVMYRSTMPDGRVVLSDRPMPGAARVQEIVPPAGNVVPSQAPAVPAKPKPAAPRAADPLSAAEAELREARKSHDEARQARDRGKEELPGERLGTAGGGTRLSDAYWSRQKALEDAVGAAEKRVQAAQQRFNALR